jgi:hypothetical protein
MTSSIVPASQLPREEVTAYLVGQGHAPEIVAWKYFDDAFNQGRNRGWAWLKEGRLAGFIGHLPFEIACGLSPNAQRLPANWLCDWSIADYESNRGAGVRLFKRALQEGVHFVLGGNANSLGPMEKMASRTRHDADIELRLFLRTGAILERVAQKLPAAKILARSPLARAPLPYKGSSRAHSALQVTPGIADSLAPLLESATSDSWRAVYDCKYLQWFLGRCPILNCWTISSANAAAVLWHPKKSPRVWRAALWTQNASAADLQATIDTSVAYARGNGGSEISFLNSAQDAAPCDALRARGFAPTPTRRPLFVFDGPQPPVQIEELRGLNFIAADLAYRF